MSDKPTIPNPFLIKRRRVQQTNALTFALLCFWLFLMYARPEDLIRSIAHLPTAIALLCLLAHTANSLGGDAEFVVLTPITSLIAGLVVWALIGMPFAHWVKVSVTTFFTHWDKILIFCLLIGHVVTNVKQLRTLVWIGVVSACAIAAISIALGHQGISGRLEAIVSGPYSGANYLSIALLIMLPFPLLYSFVGKNPFIRLWSVMLSMLLTVATLMTQSRGASVTLAVIIFFAAARLRKWRKNPVLVFGVLVLFAGILLVGFGRAVLTRWGATLAGESVRAEVSVVGRTASSTYRRLQLLYRSFIVTAEHPFMGVGIGGYTAAAVSEFTIRTSAELQPTHNTYAQFSTEMGIPGVATFICLIGFTYYVARKTRRRITVEMLKDPDHLKLAWLADAVSISVMAFAINAIFASVAWDSYFYFLAGITQAVYRLGRPLPQEVKEKRKRRAAPAMWPRLEAQPGGSAQ